MTLTEVIERRLAQGEAAARVVYIDLLDEVDDIDELYQAYMSLRDTEQTLLAQQRPLTTATLKHYVRLVHDAIRSTDEAHDAFGKDASGNVVPNKKTAVMKYLDDVRMFEVQLIAARMIKTVHKVQYGTLSIPSWPALSGLKLYKYKTFPERMSMLIQSLKEWKSICKALFFDQVPMEVRLALQPEVEAKKKGANHSLNGNRDIQLKFAKQHMPKDNTTAPGADGDDDGHDHDHEHDDHDDEEEADNEISPSRGTKRTRVAVNLGSRSRRGKVSTATRPTQPAVNTGGPIQPITPAASAPAFSATVGPALSSSGAYFVPINTSGPSNPATPTPVNDGGREQADFLAGPVFLDDGASTQGALSIAPVGRYTLGETFNPVAQSGNQEPQTFGPYTNAWRPIHPPDPYFPTQQRQSPSP